MKKQDTTIRPHHIRDYKDIPDDDYMSVDGINSAEKKNYGWYKVGNTWYPHRKPTLKEILTNNFN